MITSPMSLEAFKKFVSIFDGRAFKKLALKQAKVIKKPGF
jgi:hypothetical protein